MGEVYNFERARSFGAQKRVFEQVNSTPLKFKGAELKKAPKSASSSPMLAIILIAVVAVLYTSICVHFVGQIDYSARANLLPAMNLGDD